MSLRSAARITKAPTAAWASSSDLARTFKSIDVDSSGHVSKEELWNHLKNKGMSVEENDFDRLFSAIDVDKSGEIDLEEYSAFVSKVQQSFKRSKGIMKVKTHRDSITYPSSGGKRQTVRQRLTFSSGHQRRPSLFHRHKARATTLGKVTESAAIHSHRAQPKIRFFAVDQREYEVTASDNPCVRNGVALELSWKYNTLDRMHIDEFENMRSTERSSDFMKEKKLSRIERERTLRSLGYSQKEIDECAKRATIIRNSRKKSIGTRHLDQKHEAFEEKIRAIRKLVCCTKSVETLDDSVHDFKRLHPTLMAMAEGNDDSDD